MAKSFCKKIDDTLDTSCLQRQERSKQQMVDIFTPSIWGPIQELPGPQGAMMFKCALKPKDRRSDTSSDVEDNSNNVWQDTNMSLIWREATYT